jgi:hypothetical protein
MVATMSANVTHALAEHAEAIRRLGRRAVQDIIEIGSRLIEAKKIAPHGAWLPWLDHEFGWTERTARRYMSVAELAAKSDNVSDLNVPISALYSLAAPSTPAEAIDEIAERSAAGKRLSISVVRQTIAAARPAATVRTVRLVSSAEHAAAIARSGNPPGPPPRTLTGSEMQELRVRGAAKDVVEALRQIAFNVRGDSCGVDDVVNLLLGSENKDALLHAAREALGFALRLKEGLERAARQPPP